jgi:hypothetical protein
VTFSVLDAWQHKGPKDVDLFLSKYESVERCHSKLVNDLRRVIRATTLDPLGVVPTIDRPHASILKVAERPPNSARYVVLFLKEQLKGIITAVPSVRRACSPPRHLCSAGPA